MIKAMKQALEALDLATVSHGRLLMSNPPQDAWTYNCVDQHCAKAITALRQAIEQHDKQQAEFNAMVERVQELERQACEIIRDAGEPVAWLSKDNRFTAYAERADETWTPLYTAPPRKEFQTEQAIRHERDCCRQLVWDYGFSRIDNEDVQAACVTLAEMIMSRDKK